MKYLRVYPKFTKSVLLLGPRGTGKSTYIKDIIKPNLTIDLLKTSVFRELLKNPSLIEDMISHVLAGETVFIDEIQKIPELLDEVHRLIENKKIKFILTGSSARKLKKQGVNLLAGRAIYQKFFPLSLFEIKNRKPIDSILFTGLLPYALSLDSNADCNDFLFSYVESYLKEEIFQEGLTRNLADFTYFLELAGQYHGQIINYENIAREVSKSGEAVKAWFQILEDTLIGEMIEPYSLNLYPKETKHKKFYFFDHGIARAASGIKTMEEVAEKKGFYLESLILNELKVYKEVKKENFKIYFYNVSGKGDVDFIIEVKKKTLSQPAEFITLEIKNTKKWNSQFSQLQHEIKNNFPKKCRKSIAVYRGEQRLTQKGIEIFPLDQFIESLWSGEII
ncbi:MAG: ATP-binding protein [Bdellovibrio sp.]|nr:ATP-binding protein [Bdellovibrio sp.]